MSTKPVEIRDEYLTRHKSRASEFKRHELRSRRIWFWRRVVFIAGIILLVGIIDGVLAFWWLAIPAVVFITLMAVHEPVHRARGRSAQAMKFYQRGLSRLSDDWVGTGESAAAGERFADQTHLYSRDLDLFGRGSLFDLLSWARTGEGEARLAAWLNSPASAAEIRLRQKAIEELRPRLDLREDLAVLGAEIHGRVDSEALVEWADAPHVHFSRATRIAASVLGAATVVALLYWLFVGWGLPAFFMLLTTGIFLFLIRSRVSSIIGAIEKPSQEVKVLAAILARIEKEPFASQKLVGLRAALDVEGSSPSQQVVRLYRLIDILDSTKNTLFAPIAFAALLHAQLAFAIERWRQKSGPAVIRWIEALGEFEALSSLAGYSAEHPQDPFPEIVDGHQLFEAVAIRHPLIPASRAVPNDVTLGGSTQVLIVSGSNMSGKSTLLRTVGINAVLAFAGAPVRAKSLRLTPLAIGASIQVVDSLQQGSSRFYAEITRIRSIVELTQGDLPLLFLLDEILSGTNSHDRQIGADAILRGLVSRRAIGLITTHDLALTRIAEGLGSRAGNVHFEDHLEDGRMVFDYRMLPGVVKKSNALELMRAVGLDV